MTQPDKWAHHTTGSYYCLFVFVCLLCSCTKDDPEQPQPAARTVLIYLSGDNDLSPSITAVVESIRSGWKYTGSNWGSTGSNRGNTGSNCLIYLDPADATPRLLRLRGGCSAYPTPSVETLATYPEENSASAEVFARVVAQVQTDYPAPSYGLIVASHATGWLPAGSLANPNRPNSAAGGGDPAASPNRSTRSIGSDSNPATVGGEPQEMELADFARAIPDGAFDFIIFEACLMAGVEVAYELRNKTDYILASSAELLVPGFVPIYARSQHYLFDTSLSVEQALTGFATDYYNHINTQSGAYRSTTLSVIKCSEIDRLATLLKGVAPSGVMSSGVSPLGVMSAGVAPSGVSLDELQHFDRPGSYGESIISPRYFDLLHTLQQMLPPSRHDQVATQIAKIVVAKFATPTILMGHNGFTVHHHCGLTTYIPQAEFPSLNAAYRATAWWQRTSGINQ